MSIDLHAPKIHADREDSVICTIFCPDAVPCHGLKRLVDILFSVGALIALSPVLLIAAVGVFLDGGLPVLFRQARPGLDERPFTLLKFRSMHDGQVTKWGRFMRRWSLDELPQLFNVLRGEMSLVGPRPLLPRYLPYYTERERRRHTVRPGMTGWAQIHGRNSASWDDRLDLDIWYVENQSIGLDFRILARTAWAVISGRGVVVNPDRVELPDLDVYRNRSRQESQA
jgi:lipopolysaccharide/colanic/teichoic acid biosynthesis glycosyltransferase